MNSAASPFTLPHDHVGLYAHVPFCVQKCHYCDFASQPLCRDRTSPDQYLDALATEAAHRRAEYPGTLHSIYIGGGTPTTLTGAQLRRLWHEILDPFPRTPDAEITIEANPGTLTEDVLSALREIPLTRASLGVQSMHADELAMLGRIHTAEDVAAAVAALRAIGIPQLNLDLISALPQQTAARWAESVTQVLALHPDHLSLYTLIVEDGTPLAASVAAGELLLPSEEEEEKIADVTDALLIEAGFLRYEVSNAAPAGKHSRHNLGYWLGRDYLGIGSAAASTVGGVRWRNVDDAGTYITRMGAHGAAIEYVERLSAPVWLLERVMLGLRLAGGFDLAEAEATCGCHLQELAPETLASLEQDGLLTLTDGWMCLTPSGYPLANAVVSRLMMAMECESPIAWK